MRRLALVGGLLGAGLCFSGQDPEPGPHRALVGTILRDVRGAWVVDPAARVIELPAGGVSIEGRGELEFASRGRRVVFPESLRIRVDGEPVDERLALRPGQRLELCEADGARAFVLGWAGAEGAAEPVAGGAIAERLVWLGVDPLQDASRHQGRFRLEASDSEGAFELEVVDGRVRSVRVDGEEVPLERIEVSGRRVRVLDEGGRPRLTLDLGLHGGATWAARRIPRAFAGVSVRAPEEAGSKGLVVTRVVPASPAESAGLREHDVIVSLEGVPGVRKEHFAKLLQGKKPGDTVTFELLRDGVVRRMEVRLGDPPPPGASETPAGGVHPLAHQLRVERLGHLGVDRRGDSPLLAELSGDLEAVRRLARERVEPAAAASDARLDRVLEQLERLQQRLDAIESGLDALRRGQ